MVSLHEQLTQCPPGAHPLLKSGQATTFTLATKYWCTSLIALLPLYNHHWESWDTFLGKGRKLHCSDPSFAHRGQVLPGRRSVLGHSLLPAQALVLLWITGELNQQEEGEERSVSGWVIKVSWFPGNQTCTEKGRASQLWQQLRWDSPCCWQLAQPQLKAPPRWFLQCLALPVGDLKRWTFSRKKPKPQHHLN